LSKTAKDFIRKIEAPSLMTKAKHASVSIMVWFAAIQMPTIQSFFSNALGELFE